MEGEDGREDEGKMKKDGGKNAGEDGGYTIVLLTLHRIARVVIFPTVLRAVRKRATPPSAFGLLRQ